MPICTCPLGAEISDITIPSCPEYLGQIQKVIFQRTYSSGSTENKFVVASTDPALLASWTTYLTASDGTKAVVSTYINNPTMEPGEPTTYGGGNATVGGKEIVLSKNASVFSFELHNVPQSTIAEYKSLECETLSVYFINEQGQVIGDDEGGTTNFKGIKLQSETMNVSDKTLGGRENPDMNMVRFSLPANWSDNLSVVTPTDFNGLDLAN
jgi:hypothetical protein